MNDSESDSTEKSPGSHQPEPSPSEERLYEPSLGSTPALEEPTSGPGKSTGTAARLVPSGSTPASEPGKPASEPGSAHLLGLVDELPITWCPNCQANVKPKGKGLCPRCNRTLKGSFLARKHPVNKLRRQQILDKLVVDYQPGTTMLRASCEHLAGILEQLEVMKPGSPDHQRLVQLSQMLGEALEASRQARVGHETTNLEDLDPDEVVAKAERVLAMAKLVRDSKRQPTLPASADRQPNDDDFYVPDDEPEVPTPAPAPEPLCEFCHQSITRCAEIKETRLDSWRALHHNDPSEVERREKAATDEMFESLRRANTGGDPWVR